MRGTGFRFAGAERGGGGGVRTPPPPPPDWNLGSLISAILLELKKIVIYYLCALPQLYVKVGPSLEKFSGSAPVLYVQQRTLFNEHEQKSFIPILILKDLQCFGILILWLFHSAMNMKAMKKNPNDFTSIGKPFWYLKLASTS